MGRKGLAFPLLLLTVALAGYGVARGSEWENRKYPSAPSIRKHESSWPATSMSVAENTRNGWQGCAWKLGDGFVGINTDW